MTLIELRSDTAVNWAARNTVLGSNEPGYDTTNKILKIGDGVTAWASLPIQAGAGAGAVFVDVASLNGGAGVTQGTPTLQSGNTAEGRTQLQGQLALAAATYAGGTVLATLPAGQWPKRAGGIRQLCRTQGSATTTLIAISDVNGQITNITSIIAQPDTLNLDGIEFTHA